MTLIELLVASTLSLLVVAMATSATLANRNAFGYDIARTRLNQNLRSAFEVVGTELRQAGERLPPGVPAIEIQDGAGEPADKLTIRRNLLDEVLTTCVAATPTSGADVILTSSTAGIPACTYGSQTTNYNAWVAYRTGETPAVVKAYIYDLTAKVGEFFNYGSETDSGTTQLIRRSGGTWSRSYPVGSPVYAMREWRFELSTTPGQTDLLQIVQDGNNSSPYNVTFGLTGFEAIAHMQDGTTKTTFAATDAWTQLQSVELVVTGRDTYKGRDVRTTLSTRLFPRNILSN